MINAEYSNHTPQLYQKNIDQGQKATFQGHPVDRPDHTPGYLSDTLKEINEGTIDTLPAAKGKRSVKSLSPKRQFYTMLLDRCLSCDLMGLDDQHKQKKVVASRKLIEEAVNNLFQLLKKTEGLPTNSGPNGFDHLLGQLAKSPSGEKLYRKAVAGNMSGIEYLLRSAGVNINHQSKKSGNTPLIAAVLNHHWDMVSTLIEAGAAASATNKTGQHVLQLLFKYRLDKIDDVQHQDLIIKILAKQKDNKKIKLSDGDISLSVYAFRQAATIGHLPLLNKLLYRTPNTMDELKRNGEAKEVLILLATSHANLSQVVKHLLDVKDRNGCRVFNPDCRGRSGRTLLMIAAKYRKCETMRVLLEDSTVVAKINEGILINGKKWTAYTYAHSQGSMNMMQQLANKGAEKIKAPRQPGSDSYPTSGSLSYNSSPFYNHYSYHDYGDCGGSGSYCGGSGGDSCGGF